MELETKVRRASKEIDQVGVAVSIVGTRRHKLLALADLAQDVLDELRGERDEIKRAALALRQRIHDVRSSRTDQTSAARLSSLKSELDRVLELVSQGIGVADDTFKAGDIAVGNPWGYTREEAARALDAVKEVGRRMKALSIPTDDLTIVLDPSWSGDAKWAVYDKEWETIAMSAGAPGSVRALANQVGYALWDMLSAPDREVWGDVPARFALAFGAAIVDEGATDDWARLRVTVGRRSSKWPK